MTDLPTIEEVESAINTIVAITSIRDEVWERLSKERRESLLNQLDDCGVLISTFRENHTE